MPDLTSWGHREIEKLENEMEELFNSLCHDYGIPSVCEMIDCSPKAQFDEYEDFVSIKLVTPGFSASDITVQANSISVIVSAEKKTFYEDGHQSRSYSKSFPLPSLCDTSQISANFKNGFLLIVIKKNAPSQYRNIEISTDL